MAASASLLSSVFSLRAAFGRCRFSAHKQMGLRRLRDAQMFLARRCDDVAAEKVADARRLLAYAEAAR